ncbi:MAG: hypothetical protein ACRDXX_07315 [Stackebrandtia sp.]
MPTSDAAIVAKGREVRDKAVEKWLELDAGFCAAFPEFESAVRDEFDAVVARFERYTGRDPAGIQTMRDHLVNTVSTFGGVVAADIDALHDRTDDWLGPAGDDIDTWLYRLEQVNGNQVFLMGVLEKALEMTQALVAGSRDEIVSIGDGALAALDALDESEDSGFSFGAVLVAAVLVVTGAVVTVATAGAAAPTVAASLTVAVAAVNFGASVQAEVDRRNLRIAGGDVFEVLESMNAAIDALREITSDTQDQIAEWIEEDIAKVEQLRHWFVPPCPDAARA